MVPCVRKLQAVWQKFLHRLRAGTPVEQPSLPSETPAQSETRIGSMARRRGTRVERSAYRIAPPLLQEPLDLAMPSTHLETASEWAPVHDVIDLHTFHPKDIPSVVEEFLWAARRQKIEHVRIIHGKGKGVQRQRVQKILASHPDVVYFRDAPADAGGWGATLAQLRIQQSPDVLDSDTKHHPNE